MEHPDAKMHLKISLMKSVIRIIAAVGLLAPAYGASSVAALWFCGAGLITAEILGIYEELV